MNAKEVIAELGAIARQRQLVKTAPISEDMKQRLLADLERQALQLGQAFKTDIDPAVQAGAAQQGRGR